MRHLGRTLLAGGVVYPAGTREEDIAVKVTRDDVWDGESTVSEVAVDGTIAGPWGAAGGAYEGLDVDALKAEIDKRNEDREQDARISKRGNAETLVAALVADDQREG